MAQTTQISFRIDSEIQGEAERVLYEIGLSMEDAVTAFLTKVVREHRVPFELPADPFYSEGNIRYLEEKMENYRNGKLDFAEHEFIED